MFRREDRKRSSLTVSESSEFRNWGGCKEAISKCGLISRIFWPIEYMIISAVDLRYMFGRSVFVSLTCARLTSLVREPTVVVSCLSR